VNRSLVSPREVFIDALKCGAVYFILLHNHPSGIIEPSRDDFRITKDLYTLGEMMGIPLRDHIIIGNDGYLSFFERGYFNEIQL
jgi:DNA repair protein RadC